MPVTADRIDPVVRVTDIDVIVPRDLVVSEAHLYYPIADIVWREDAPGNRHDQVEVIFENAMDWGLSAFNDGRSVAVTVRLQRFHAVSQKARYSVGGIHAFIKRCHQCHSNVLCAGVLAIDRATKIATRHQSDVVLRKHIFSELLIVNGQGGP